MDRMRVADHPVRRQRGLVTPLVVAVMALVTLLLLGVARLGAAANDRARAHLAADAAALAGAAEGRSAAAALAAKNGGQLVAFRVVGTDTIVTVVVGKMRAMARARADPPALGPRRPLAARSNPV
jgi:hypothetical protein